ncbi:DUF3330 domain-containing protein [Salmonella enterica subsp. enterica]|nr:DUF3330 domain-containing protein [Salmonella enterica subsp. enterica]
METPTALRWLRQARVATPCRVSCSPGGLPAARPSSAKCQPMNTTMNANEPSTSCCVCCKEIPLDTYAFTPEGAGTWAFLRAGVLSALRARASTATETSVKPDACDSPPPPSRFEDA